MPNWDIAKHSVVVWTARLARRTSLRRTEDPRADQTRRRSKRDL
jgi:hypothetical protein